MNTENINQQNGESAEPQKDYRFQYLQRGALYLAMWQKKMADFGAHGKVLYFYPFLCPVATASVNVRERTRVDYDSIELFILRLYAASVTSPEVISEMLGIDLKMVQNIINLMENTYQHISSGELTDKGRESLADGKNIQVFDTVMQVQFEAITGTLLSHELWQNSTGIDSFYWQKKPDRYKRFLPVDSIGRDLSDEVKEHLDSELVRYKGKEMIDLNIEEILGACVDEILYVEAFMIRYDFLPHPFILFPVQGRERVFWNPVAISESVHAEMQNRGLSFDFGKRTVTPVVRPDADFEPLSKIEREYALTEQKAKIGDVFTRGGKNPATYEVVPEGSEGAKLMMHPEHVHLSVYAKEIHAINPQEEVTPDVDLHLSDS